MAGEQHEEAGGIHEPAHEPSSRTAEQPISRP